MRIQTLAVPVHHPQHWQQTRYLHAVGQQDVQVKVPCQAGSTETDPVADQGHGAPGWGVGVSAGRGEKTRIDAVTSDNNISGKDVVTIDYYHITGIDAVTIDYNITEIGELKIDCNITEIMQ